MENVCARAGARPSGRTSTVAGALVSTQTGASSRPQKRTAGPRTRSLTGRHHIRVTRCSPALLLAVLALAGCGTTTGSDRPNEAATLLLDGRPGAIDSGIYLARERGYDEAEGVTLRVRPSPRGL